MPRLQCPCQDCGAHAKIAVLMPRLRCSCQDWGAHAEIEVLKSPQSWPEHRNLGMSTSNSAWAPQSKHSNYLCKWGRHHQLDYLTRPRKSSWATNYIYLWSFSLDWQRSTRVQHLMKFSLLSRQNHTLVSIRSKFLITLHLLRAHGCHGVQYAKST